MSITLQAQHAPNVLHASSAPLRNQRRSYRASYLKALTFAFVLCSSVRVIAYLPTLWAIHHSGDASQHSLLTWVTWSAANLTMAAWLYEHNGQRADRATLVSVCNAVMCLATTALITFHRW